MKIVRIKYIDKKIKQWYSIGNRKKGVWVQMNKIKDIIAESLVAVHTHTHYIIK